MSTETQFTVQRGETFIANATLKESDGTPRDITDYNFTGSMKPTFSSATEYEITITKTSAVSGSIKITLDTTTIPAGRYPYNIFIESGSVRKNMLKGSMIVEESTL